MAPKKKPAKTFTKQVAKKGIPASSGNDFSGVSLITHPVLTVKVIAILIGRLVKSTLSFIITHYLLIFVLVSLIGAF